MGDINQVTFDPPSVYDPFAVQLPASAADAALAFPSSSSDPTNPAPNAVWYNTTASAIKANVVGVYDDIFTASAGQTSFTTTKAVAENGVLEVRVNGGTSVNGYGIGYSVAYGQTGNTATVTLDVAPPAGSQVTIRYLLASNVGASVVTLKTY